MKFKELCEVVNHSELFTICIIGRVHYTLCHGETLNFVEETYNSVYRELQEQNVMSISTYPIMIGGERADTLGIVIDFK